MSTAIDSVTISTIEDRRIVLSSSQIARKISIGTSWSSIRIGMRFAFSDFGANVTGTPRMYFGLLAAPTSGLTNGPLSAVTSHFVGIRTGGFDSTWTRAAGPPVNYYPLTCRSWAAKKVGATDTVLYDGNNLVARFSAAEQTTRYPLILEITKGTPNYTVAFGLMGTTGPPNDLSKNTLIAAMQAANLTGAGATCTTAIGGSWSTNTGSGAVSAADGDLDSICVAWDRLTPTMHISDLMWAKLA